MSLRERKKAETRQRIQEHAMRLFLAQGYDATTVEQIAAAAGVSHMTFFRNFPAKEDVVTSDDYDPIMAELIRARPAGEHPVERVRATVLAGLAAVYERDKRTILARAQLIQSTPALRSRLVDNRRSTEELFADGLGDPADFGTRVLAAACAAALIAAVEEWAAHPERADLPELVDRAFTALRESLR